MDAELQKNCATKAGMAYQIDDIYVRGSKILCTSQCPCAADKTKWPAAQQATMVTDAMGVNELTDCPSDSLTNYQRDKILPAIQALEKSFSCAGVCTTPNYLLFSNVALGPPVGNCKDELVSWI